MFLIQTEPAETLEASGVTMTQAPATLFANNELKASVANQLAHGEKDIAIKSSIWKQIYYVTEREVTGTLRNRVGLIIRFGLTIFLNLIYGLIFFQAGGKDHSNPTNLNSHFGALTMVSVSLSYSEQSSDQL